MAKPGMGRRPPQGTGGNIINPARDRAIDSAAKRKIAALELPEYRDQDLNDLIDAFDFRDTDAIKRLIPICKAKFGAKLFKLVKDGRL